MTNRIADARGALADALIAALPAGWDVFRYPPPGHPPAPGAWIDRTHLALDLASPALKIVRLGVVLAVDGEHDGQMAALDEATAASWDAMSRIKGVEVESVEPYDPDGSATSPGLRGALMAVAVTLAARTFCDPPLITTSPALAGREKKAD